jgi:arylsulfatase A-like enzyme
MTRLGFRLCVAMLFCVVCSPLSNRALADEPRRPNIVIVLADDLGFSDLGCYGGEIETPELDRLAKAGLQFTQFYNTARCWPTRGALLTGYYPQQIRRDRLEGIPSGNGGKRPAWAKLLPERLRQSGYRSYLSGKWHVDGSPLAGGFDRCYLLDDHDRFFGPKNHSEDGKPLPTPGPDDNYYATTAIADHAIRCLRDHRAQYGEQPFFSYVAFTAPHFPLQAKAEDIARYRERYLDGWDDLREQRWQRMSGLGLKATSLSLIDRAQGPTYPQKDAQAKLGPLELERALPWSELTPQVREFQATKMAVHAAMVDRMDREIGRIVAELRAMGELERTMFVFLSDNGATAEMMVRGDGHDSQRPAGSAGTFLSLGPGWSALANTPFRKHKTWVHEGGISTPLIVHWPEGIKSPGEKRDMPGHVIDLVPTVLELAGLDAAAEKQDAPPLAGKSLLSVFTGDGAALHSSLWWEHEGNRAYREGDWKIVAAGKNNPWELYDLSQDRTELKDLAKAEPERVSRMAAAWTAQLDEFRKQASSDLEKKPE